MARRIRPTFKFPSLPKDWKQWAFSMAFAALLLTTVVLLASSTFGVFPALVATIGIASWLAPSLVAIASLVLGALIGGLYQWTKKKHTEHRPALMRSNTTRNIFQAISEEKSPIRTEAINYARIATLDAVSTGFLSARSSATTQIVTDSTKQVISPSTKRR